MSPAQCELPLCRGNAGDPAFAERFDEVAVIVAHHGGVVQPEVHHVCDEAVVIVSDHRDDGLLGLEVDQRLVAVGVADAVHLGHRLTELLDDFGSSSGSVNSLQSRSAS